MTNDNSTLSDRLYKFKHECKVCHKIFYNESRMNRFCSEECERIYKSQKITDWTKKVKETHRPIIDIAKAATEAGMTYGEYVARHIDNK